MTISCLALSAKTSAKWHTLKINGLGHASVTQLYYLSTLIGGFFAIVFVLLL
jgi:hypothetical protein